MTTNGVSFMGSDPNAFFRIRAVSSQAMSTWTFSKRTRSVKAWMVKAAGLIISWLNDGSGASSTRKHIWPNITISEKHGRQSVNMCTLTTLNVVILHSIIRHRDPAIIRFCYWMIMQPKGGFSPLPSYTYQFIIKNLDFCLDNWTTIKTYDYVFNYFSNSGILVEAIKEYHRTAKSPKGEYTLLDLLK